MARNGPQFYNLTTGEFSPGVMACVNAVLLLDRRTLKVAPTSDLCGSSGPYKWVVYNSTDTKYFGEWQGYKTRKAAIAAFVKLAKMQRTGHIKKLDGLVKEAWDAETARLASLGVD